MYKLIWIGFHHKCNGRTMEKGRYSHFLSPWIKATYENGAGEVARLFHKGDSKPQSLALLDKDGCWFLTVQWRWQEGNKPEFLWFPKLCWPDLYTTIKILEVEIGYESWKWPLSCDFEPLISPVQATVIYKVRSHTLQSVVILEALVKSYFKPNKE